MTLVNNIWNDERGQDLIEYALMAGFVALAAAGLSTSMGTSITGVFTKIQTMLGKAAEK